MAFGLAWVEGGAAGPAGPTGRRARRVGLAGDGRAPIAAFVTALAVRQVPDTVPHSPAAVTAMVDGAITRFDKGRAALRRILGAGAGRARVVGHLRVSAPAGGIVQQLMTSKSHDGGGGMGGADLADVESPARRPGAAMAAAIVAWKRTGRLPSGIFRSFRIGLRALSR